MKSLLFAVAIVLFLAGSVASAQSGRASKRKSPASLTGTYKASWGQDAYGTLKILQIPGDSIRFLLYCNSGSPSRNSGEASGVIRVADGVARYLITEFGDTCELAFEFKGNRVNVTQSTIQSCGFGSGVTCDGTFLLKSRKRPIIETDRADE